MDYLNDLTLPSPCCYCLFGLICITFLTAHSTLSTQLLNVSQNTFLLWAFKLAMLSTWNIPNPAAC